MRQSLNLPQWRAPRLDDCTEPEISSLGQAVEHLIAHRFHTANGTVNGGLCAAYIAATAYYSYREDGPEE